MTKRTIISTLRHASTQFNNEKRYAGTIDIPLSENGVRESKEVSEKIKSVKYDVVITSTLRRSYETAHIIFDGSIPIIKTPLCNERNFGIMEGLTWEDIQKIDPPVLVIKVGNDLHTVNPKNGEPFENILQRAKRFKRFILANYRGKIVLVISHGVFLQVFHGLLKGVSLIESLLEYPSNLEIAKFIFDDNKIVSNVKIPMAQSDKIRW